MMMSCDIDDEEEYGLRYPNIDEKVVYEIIIALVYVHLYIHSTRDVESLHDYKLFLMRSRI
jgi:hypothetical protein